MKADILDMQAARVASIDLPMQFEEEIRPDLIKRAFLSIQSSSRQTYGAFPEAGKRQYANLSRRRRDYKATYGKGISRAPRKILVKRGSQFIWVGAFAPGAVSGRRAHPPKASRIFIQEINRKENQKAIRSAIAASASQEYVKLRGHRFSTVPIIFEDHIESIIKSKDFYNLMIKIGLNEELSRLNEKSIRPGKGKNRGRRYMKKTGPLVVVSKQCPLMNASKNMEGFEFVTINNLNAYLLAPGGHAGRLIIWSKSAIEKLKSESLFMSNKPKNNQKKEISEPKVEKKKVTENSKKVSVSPKKSGVKK